MKRTLLCLLAGVLLCPALSASAWGPQNYIEESALPAAVQSAMESETFCQAIEELPYLYIVTEDTGGLRTLTIYRQNGEAFTAMAVSAPLPVMNGIAPSIIASTESVCILYSESLLYHFSPDTDGAWRLTTVQGEHDYRCTPYWLIETDADPIRMVCGADPSPTLEDFNPQLFPPDLDEAAELLHTTGYALVNNPDPADQLNLRESPDKAAASLGKYYNGTPVTILQDTGKWARVSVGGIEGYMMQQYLAFGTDMLTVEPAFPDLFIKPELYGTDRNVYLSLTDSSCIAGVVNVPGDWSADITVIGIVGDGWVHVICDNGLAGYMPAEDFYPGNG